MPPATRSKNRVMSPEALDVLLGTEAPKSRGERLVQAVRRKREEKAGSVYQRSFLKFWAELVWTKDEARAGEVRKAPDWPMFRDLEHYLLTEPLLFLDKSRRVMASWFVCAFDVWLLAGGQDPRWPALMRSTRNRQVIIASRKLEDLQGSAWFLTNRVRFIVDELEQRGIREVWPTWPTWTWTATTGQNSHGGRTDAVPQGKDQMRGGGATIIHAEEVATWEQAQPSIEAGKLVTQGGGHFVCLSTAAVGTYAADLVMDKLNERGWR